MNDLPEIFYESFCPETKSLWRQYTKEKDEYKQFVILEKIVKVITKSSMEAYDKMIKQREQGRK